MSQRFAAVPLLACLVWLAPVGGPGAAEAAPGAARLDAYFRGLTTLRADFEQRVTTSQGGDQRLEGVLYLQRPGRFRWEYRTPAQLLVGDGHTIWLEDFELEQISHRSQEQALRGTPAQLLVGEDPPETHFAIEDLGAAGAGLDWVALTPRQEDSELVRILLGFDGAELREMEMVDGFGQVTWFRFSAVQRNPTLDPALFEFTPPPGIDVIGD